MKSIEDSVLKNETLTKLTHMTWKRPPSNSNFSVDGSHQPQNMKLPEKCGSPDERKSGDQKKDAKDKKKLSKRHRKTCATNKNDQGHTENNSDLSPSRTDDLEKNCVHGSQSEEDQLESGEGPGISRNLILERRKNLVKYISKPFFRTFKPSTCRNFQQFCFMNGRSLRETFDKVFAHHRRSKKASEPTSLPDVSCALTETPSSLNVRAAPFCPRMTEDSALTGSNIVLDNSIKDSQLAATTTTSSTPVSILPSFAVQKSSSIHCTQSVKNGVTTRGFLIHRNRSSTNCEKVAPDSQTQLLDSKSEEKKYVLQTLRELDAQRLNNFALFQGYDENNGTSLSKSNVTNNNNMVYVTTSRPSSAESAMSNALNSTSKLETRRLTSTATSNVTASPEAIRCVSTTPMSSAHIPGIIGANTIYEFLNSSRSNQSKPIVASCPTCSLENNLESLSQAVHGTAVTGIRSKDVCHQLWSGNQETPQFNDDSTPDIHFLSHLSECNAHGADLAPCKSNSSPFSDHCEENLKSINLVSPKALDTRSSVAESCHSKPKEIFSFHENFRNPTPDMSVNVDFERGNYKTEGGLNHSIRSDDNFNRKLLTARQPQSVVGTLVPNLATAIDSAAIRSNPQLAFATGARAGQTCSVTNQHFLVSGASDVQLRRSPGVSLDQKPRIQEQYQSNFIRTDDSSLLASVPSQNVSDPGAAQKLTADYVKSVPEPILIMGKAPQKQNTLDLISAAMFPDNSTKRYIALNANNVSIYPAPNPQVISDQCLPVEPFKSINQADGVPHSDSRNPRYSLVTNAEFTSIASSLSKYSSRNYSQAYSEVDVSDQASTFVDRCFGNEPQHANEANNPSKQFVSSSSTQFIPPGAWRNVSALPSNQTIEKKQRLPESSVFSMPQHDLNSAVSYRQNTSLPIPSQHSSIVRTRRDENFEGECPSFTPGDEKCALPQCDSFTALQFSQLKLNMGSPTSANIPPVDRGASYLSSAGVNLGLYSRVSTPNQQPNTARRIDGQLITIPAFNRMETNPASAVRPGSDLRKNFSQFYGGGDGCISLGHNETASNDRPDFTAINMPDDCHNLDQNIAIR